MFRYKIRLLLNWHLLILIIRHIHLIWHHLLLIKLIWHLILVLIIHHLLLIRILLLHRLKIILLHLILVSLWSKLKVIWLLLRCFNWFKLSTRFKLSIRFKFTTLLYHKIPSIYIHFLFKVLIYNMKKIISTFLISYVLNFDSIYFLAWFYWIVDLSSTGAETVLSNAIVALLP